MRFKKDIPTYNASIYVRTKSSEREKWRGPNKKKIREFMIRVESSVRMDTDAGNFDASFHHCLHRIAYCQSDRLLILLERGEAEIFFWMANGMFKKKDIVRHGPRLMLNNCQILDPPYFSLPTTFNSSDNHFNGKLLAIHAWVVSCPCPDWPPRVLPKHTGARGVIFHTEIGDYPSTPADVFNFCFWDGDGPRRMFMNEWMMYECIYCIKEK